jgi:hypothetical protein
MAVGRSGQKCLNLARECGAVNGVSLCVSGPRPMDLSVLGRLCTGCWTVRQATPYHIAPPLLFLVIIAVTIATHRALSCGRRVCLFPGPVLCSGVVQPAHGSLL